MQISPTSSTHGCNAVWDDIHPELFRDAATPKEDECVQLSHRAAMYRNKDAAWFEAMMAKACGQARRIAKPDGHRCLRLCEQGNGWVGSHAGSARVLGMGDYGIMADRH